MRKQEQVAEAAASKKKAKSKPAMSASPSSSSTAGPAKLSYKEKKELEETERRIEAAEERKAAIESDLSSGITDLDVITSLSEELGDLLATLESDMERWAELAERA